MVLKDAKLVGTSYTVVSGEYLFVLYLATNLEERSRGIGSKILDEMKDLYKDKMFVLNIDSVNKTSSNYLEQKRREKFYIKNGFYRADFSIESDSKKFDVMFMEENITLEKYLKIFSKFYFGKSDIKVI